MTRMELEAATIRSNADQAKVASIIAEWPHHDDIKGRDDFELLELNNLPRDLVKRKAAATDGVRKNKASLAQDIETYERMKRDGLHAFSDYDLTIAHQGDGLAALRMGLYLKRNHIVYHRSLIQGYERELARIAVELFEDRPQLALF